MPKMCLITAMKCGKIHMRTIYHSYICYRKNPITTCKHEGYLSQARPIISYFKLCVYDMIDLNSMVFMFKLTTICFQIIYVKLLFESVIVTIIIHAT